MSTPCPNISCVINDDLATCAPIYATGPISLLVSCPPNALCPAGLFPQVMTFQIADIPPVVFCIFSDSVPIVLALQGCLGLISRTLPAGSSLAVIQAAAASIQAEWAGQQAQCLALQEIGVKTGFFLNDAQIFTCPNGSNPTTSGAYVPQTMVFGGLGQSITLMVANGSDNTILGADFRLDFSNGGVVIGSVDIAPHTTFQEWNTVGGSPLLSWIVSYQGHVIFSNPNNTNVVTLTVIFLNPFNGGGGVSVVGNQVMVPAGVVSAATKAEANATARKMLNDTVAAGLANGTIQCS